MKAHFYVCLILSYATLYSFFVNLIFACALKYFLIKYEVPKYLSHKCFENKDTYCILSPQITRF